MWRAAAALVITGTACGSDELGRTQEGDSGAGTDGGVDVHLAGAWDRRGAVTVDAADVSIAVQAEGRGYSGTVTGAGREPRSFRARRPVRSDDGLFHVEEYHETSGVVTGHGWIIAHADLQRGTIVPSL